MSKKDVYRMELIRSIKGKEAKDDPLTVARGDFRSLLRLSLNDLVTAGNMALDQRLPECLSLFAKEIIRTDDGVPFRPELRKLVKEWLNDETLAMTWMDYLHRNEMEIDPYLRNILHPLLKVLIGEPADKTAEAVKVVSGGNA